MAESVFEFKERLLKGDFGGLGQMLHQGWLRKKTLASNVSSSLIDDLYNAGINAGAWGGKVVGAGGGGCLLFVVPPEKKADILENVKKTAEKNNFSGFQEIPVKMVRNGVEILADENARPMMT